MSDDERTARAAWSRLVEPGDEVARSVLFALGGQGALELVRSGDVDANGAPARTVPIRAANSASAPPI